MMKLKVTYPEKVDGKYIHGQGKVVLEDEEGEMDITPVTYGVDIRLRAGEISEATIKLVAEGVELDLTNGRIVFEHPKPTTEKFE